MAETLVGGLAAPEAVVNLLQNHGQLEHAEHFVPGKRRQIAAGLLGVVRHEFVAREPARARWSPLAEWCRAPASNSSSTASGRGRYSGSPTVVISQSSTASIRSGAPSVEHHVVELEIVVNQRRRAGRRNGRGQPRHHAIHFRTGLGPRALPALGPSLHLPFDESLRLAERDQPVFFDIDAVQLDQAIDKRAADALRVIFVTRRSRAEC